MLLNPAYIAYMVGNKYTRSALESLAIYLQVRKQICTSFALGLTPTALMVQIWNALSHCSKLIAADAAQQLLHAVSKRQTFDERQMPSLLHMQGLYKDDTKPEHPVKRAKGILRVKVHGFLVFVMSLAINKDKLATLYLHDIIGSDYSASTMW